MKAEFNRSRVPIDVAERVSIPAFPEAGVLVRRSARRPAFANPPQFYWIHICEIFPLPYCQT